MSYSICLKCKKMVSWYDKYCSDCQEKFGLPNLPEWQKDNFVHEDFDNWAKKETEKDLTCQLGGKDDLHRNNK